MKMPSPTQFFDLGYECKLYRGAPGDVANVLVDTVIDLEFTDVREKRDTSTRKSQGRRTYRAGLRDVGISFKLPANGNDAHYLAFAAAYAANTPLAILLQNSADSDGLLGDYYVEEFSGSEPLDGVAVDSIRLVPTDTYGRVPDYV
jgi:hypothetical protein